MNWLISLSLISLLIILTTLSILWGNPTNRDNFPDRRQGGGGWAKEKPPKESIFPTEQEDKQDDN